MNEDKNNENNVSQNKFFQEEFLNGNESEEIIEQDPIVNFNNTKIIGNQYDLNSDIINRKYAAQKKKERFENRKKGLKASIFFLLLSIIISVFLDLAIGVILGIITVIISGANIKYRNIVTILCFVFSLVGVSTAVIIDVRNGFTMLDSFKKYEFTLLARNYTSKIKSLWDGNDLICKDKYNEYISNYTLKSGTYYVKIDTKNLEKDETVFQILNSEKKSPWKDKDLTGYIKIEVTSTNRYTISIALSDGTHGIIEPVEMNKINNNHIKMQNAGNIVLPDNAKICIKK